MLLHPRGVPLSFTWHIESRYYACEVQFSMFDSPAQVQEELNQEGHLTSIDGISG